MSTAEIGEEEATYLCARLARLFLSCGADVTFCLRQVHKTASIMDKGVNVEVVSDAVFAMVGSAARVTRPVATSGVNMRQLKALSALVLALQRKSTRACDLKGVLDELEAGPRPRPAWLAMVAVAVTAGSLARLFGAAWPVVLAALCAGAGGQALRLLLQKASMSAPARSFAIALASGLVAIAVIRIFPGQSPVLCLSAAGMVLVPGAPLLNGVRDLVDGHTVVAISRLVAGGMTILAIGLALLVAASLCGETLPLEQAPVRLPVWEDMIFSMATVFGYAILLDVPAEALPVALACALVSHPLRTALADWNVDLSLGSLAGATAAGVLAHWAGRVQQQPAVTFAFPGVVAMVPGSYGFRAGLGGLRLMAQGSSSPLPLVAETASLTLTTCAMTVAIGVGLSVAFSLPFIKAPFTKEA